MTDTPDTPDPDRSTTTPPDRSGPVDTGPVRWPVLVATPLIFAVFIAGAVWSFREQTALARSAGFHIPELLPLTIDGFAIAMAAVAWAASLDGRPAVLARLGVAVGIACSVTANGAYASDRSGGDPLTVTLAAGVPVLAMVAFEAVLAEVRRQVQRRRGLPRPVPVPLPRLVTVGLSPIRTPRLWRRLVLELTDPRKQFAGLLTAGPDQVGTAGPTGAPTAAAAQAGPLVDRSRTGATITSINRSRPVRTVSGVRKRTGRAAGRATGHSEVALRDAQAVLDRYGDAVPSREVVRLQMGWGSPKAGNALKAVPAVRAASRDRSADRSDAREGTG